MISPMFFQYASPGSDVQLTYWLSGVRIYQAQKLIAG